MNTLVYVCLLIWSGSAVGQSQDFRLPKSLVPTHYSLQLQPILDQTPGHTKFTAPGKVTITVNCTEGTDTIKVHALDLTIIENATKVSSLNGGQLYSIVSQKTEPDNQFHVINLGESLSSGGQYEIHLEFITPVSQSRLDGMYLDEYVDPRTNQTKYVATTLFAAINARRCFPSFDEPHLKAVFSISLVRKNGYHSLSNMHQISTEPLEGTDDWYVDKFAPSLPMATYLVAMIVSDMTYEEAPPSNSITYNATIRVYAPYYLIDRGGGVYAANQTQNVLSKFDEYLDSTFMLQKLDSVSLPRFFFSAMENWGLITYNDRVLLYFPEETTEQERYRITSIVAHEVSHHFFGNLVTCEWWTWIWLNEGSATYFSHVGVEMTYPEFNPWDRFINDVYQVALEFDAGPSTHPVANEPSSLSDIGGVYDDIAYEKGASLLRMMQSFLTEDVMQAGIRRYIKEKQFKTAQQDDLFQILQETAEQFNKAQPASVKAIMDTWTLQSGFPLVRVSRVNSTHVKFTQKKYSTLSSEADSRAIEEGKWWIPISISVILPQPKEYFFWMPGSKNGTTFDFPESEIFVVNSKSEGYYRTLYSDELFEVLLNSQEELNCRKGPLTSAAKAKIFDDYVSFRKFDLTDAKMTSILGKLCLENENLLVWETVLKHFTQQLLQTYKTKAFSDADNMKLFLKESLLEKINSALDRLETLENNAIGENMMLRSELLFWSCLLSRNQSRCIEPIKQVLPNWLEKTEMEENIKLPFPVDFEDTYLCVASSSMKDDDSERLLKVAETRRWTKPCAFTRMLSALICTPHQASFEKVLSELRKEFKEFKNLQEAIPTVRINSENVSVIRAALRLLFNKAARPTLRQLR